MKLYQAEWCPFSHRVRAKLTELGVGYEAVNVPASAKEREELEEIAGTRAIPVLVDGEEEVISDSGEAISYLEREYGAADPRELELHRRELSPTVYGTPPLAVEEAVGRLREALEGAGMEVVGELDLSPFLDGDGAYKVLLAVDGEFLRLAAGATPGVAALAVLKVAVYEEGGQTRVDAVEPEKGAAQVRDAAVNERGLELRKRFIRAVKALERAGAGGEE
jgi:glutathione S-transferase